MLATSNHLPQGGFIYANIIGDGGDFGEIKGKSKFFTHFHVIRRQFSIFFNATDAIFFLLVFTRDLERLWNVFMYFHCVFNCVYLKKQGKTRKNK